MDDLPSFQAFLISFGVGLLLGIERQRRPKAVAGMRTFALTSVVGTACAMLSEKTGSPWLLPSALLLLAAMSIVSDAMFSFNDKERRPDTTTTVALVLCGLYGAMLWYGYVQMTVALALGTAALLYFKTTLHGISERLSHKDVVSFLQFGAISFVVLPVLPDRGFGPYDALNPYEIWMMVVVFAGVGLTGYVALKLIGARQTPLMFGVLGGLVSSTATTLAFARAARKDDRLSEVAHLVILTANLTMLLRVSAIAAALAPGILKALIPMLLIALLAGLPPVLMSMRRFRSGQNLEGIHLGSPLELPAALTFAAIYAGALLFTAWMHDVAGHLGVYVVAPLLGTTDMDAISLSTLQLFGQQQLTAGEASRALAMAIAANLLFKAVLAYLFGYAALALRIFKGFAFVLAGLAAGLFVLPP